MTAYEFRAAAADTAARAALNNARQVLERALSELDHYLARYEIQEGDPELQAQELHYVIQHLTTYIAANLRIDMLSDAQARLAYLAAQAQAAAPATREAS